MNINKRKLRKTLYIYSAIILVLIFSSRTIYNLSLPKVAVAMPQSGRLTKVLEARGVVGFLETYDIYAASSGQIDEIFIKKGDSISENTLVATYTKGTSGAGDNSFELELNVERIKNQLDALALNRSAIQEQLNTLSISSADDLHGYQWAVADAKTILEKRQTELLEAQRFMEIPFNSHNPVQAATDAERDWNRIIAELKDAEAALSAIGAGNSTFDSLIYQQNIDEALVSLDRRKSDLKDANEALIAITQSGSSAFDSYTYQNIVNTAKTAYDRTLEDYNEALRQYDIAQQQYYNLVNDEADDAEIAAAQTKMNNAQSLVTSAKRALDDASAALVQAANEMKRAEDAFNANRTEHHKQSIAEAEKRVMQAQLEADDAERVYDNAVSELKRAKDAFDSNSDELRRKNIIAAEKRVEIALAAVDEAAWNARKKLGIAETNLADAQTALERAEVNLDLAQKALINRADDAKKSLNLDLQRSNLDLARISIDLRAAESSLASVSSPNTAGIGADYQGIIISVEKKRGQLVSQGEKIAVVGINKGFFTIAITMPESEGIFVEIGDEVNIYKSGSNTAVKTVVHDIVPDGGGNKKIILVFEAEDFKGGEYVSVKFQKQTEIYNAVVPNEAVFSEGIGNFVWIIQSRQGALGVEYFSTKVKVLIADSDDFYTAVSRGLEYAAPVVVSHNKELTANGRVSRMD